MFRRVLLSLLLVGAAPPAALAAPDRTALLSATAPSYSWDGAAASGANTGYDPTNCSHVPDTYCDQTLLEVSGPAGTTGELKVNIGGYDGPHCVPLDGVPRGPCDFSLRLYASDATGKPGRELAQSGEDSGEEESVVIRRAVPGFYLVVVFYYSVVQASYEGTATLQGLVVPAPPPPGTAGPSGAFPSAGALTSSLKAAGRAGARGGVPVRLVCSIVCTGELIAELSAAQARRHGLGRRKLVVASASVTVDGAEGRVVRLRLKSRYAKRLARARGVRLTVRGALRDSARTQRTAPRLTVKLAAPA